jgi:hypothetical protein
MLMPPCDARVTHDDCPRCRLAWPGMIAIIGRGVRSRYPHFLWETLRRLLRKPLYRPTSSVCLQNKQGKMSGPGFHGDWLMSQAGMARQISCLQQFGYTLSCDRPIATVALRLDWLLAAYC